MGFLEKLWDETLAGPTPEAGLGKLRKYNSFSAASSGVRLPPVKDDVPVVTRSIMIIRNTVSEPVSPSSSSSAATTPRTPNTPDSPGGYFKKFTRRKASGDPTESSDYRSPTISDWVIMSALDRC